MRTALLKWILLFACTCNLHPQTIAKEGDQASFGTVQGTVLDGTGAAIQNAGITLTAMDGAQNPPTKVMTDESGSFFVQLLPPGVYVGIVSAPGFAVQTVRLTIAAGETKDLREISLTVAPASSTVQVTPSGAEVAAEQLRIEEQQRLLGVVPNFLVTYQRDAAPLNKKQKFQLTFKLVSDPAAFGITGIIAGIEQASDAFPGYGQGARGFGRRYGAAYGNFFIGNVLGSAVLPSLLKQDPRYFVKGEGSVKGRVLYALANSVVRKGDNRRWQPDYSGILGNLAAGGISNAYYPASSRNGASVTFQNAAIGIAAGAAANLLQEFVFRRITPKAKTQGATASAP